MIGVSSAGFALPPLAALAVVTAAEMRAAAARWIRSSLDRPLLAFGLAALASAATSQWPLTVLLSVAVFALLALVIVRSTLLYVRPGPARAGLLLRVWVAGAGAAAVWVLARAAAAGIRWPTGPLERGGLGATLAVASVLAAGLLLAGPARPRWLPAALALTLAALVATFSRASWLGLLAGLLTLLATGRPRARLRLLAAGAVVVLAAAALLPRWPALDQEVRSIASVEANRNRLLLWRAAAEMVADHPLLGLGFGTFPLAYPAYKSPQARERAANFAHNIFLNVAAETGVLGLAAFAVLVAIALRSAWRRWRQAPAVSEARGLAAAVLAGLVAFLSIQLFEGTVMFAHLTVGLFVLLALGASGEQAVAAG